MTVGAGVRMCCAMCGTRGERCTESMNDAEDKVGATWVRVCIVCIATGMRRVDRIYIVFQCKIIKKITSAP